MVFNDLFIGVSSHVSARYKISYNDQTEEHSSSGLIISTQAGSTGWLSFVFNMAYGITGLFEKNLKHKRPKLKDDELLFAVREPFHSVRTQTGITTSIIRHQLNLRIESLMPTNGVIFSDGVETDFLKFNSGSIATVGIAKDTAKLIQKLVAQGTRFSIPCVKFTYLPNLLSTSAICWLFDCASLRFVP